MAAAAVVLAAALVVLGVIALAAQDDEQERPTERHVVDEQTGSYRGIRMGASEERVRAVFGDPGDDMGFMPLGKQFSEIGGPPAVAVWPRGDLTRSTVLRYEDAAFLVGSRGVYAFIVTAAGATSRRGVGIGDELAMARDRYDLGCSEAVAGEPIGGGDTPTYPYCRGTVGRIRIWFGEDPIASIALARVGPED